LHPVFKNLRLQYRFFIGAIHRPVVSMVFY
jgi:hypothetical protein